MKSRNRNILIATGLVAVMSLSILIPPVRRFLHPVYLIVMGKVTVEQRLNEFADSRVRIESLVKSAGVSYPPRHVVILGLKDEKRLEVYAGDTRDNLRFIISYPILATSGTLGPKLAQGDRMVPEGVYPVDSLNPNSRFHAAIRVGYPNQFDKKQALIDGRMNLGGDIMIHGGNASVGCLAMGDPVSELLFVLVADAGIKNTMIILSPVDLRARPIPLGLDLGWQHELYTHIKAEISWLKPPL